MRIKDIKDEQFVSNSLYGEGKVVGRTDDSIDVLFKDNEIVTFKSRGKNTDDVLTPPPIIEKTKFNFKIFK